MAKPSLTDYAAVGQVLDVYKDRDGVQYLRWGRDGLGDRATVSYSFVGPTNADTIETDDPDKVGTDADFIERILTSAEIAKVRAVMDRILDVADLTLNRINPGGYSNDGQIVFQARDTGLGNSIGTWEPTTPSVNHFTGHAVTTMRSGDDGSFSIAHALHETLHSLGLQHPGSYNATPDSGGFTYEADAVYAQDTKQYTIMSYFGASNTGANWDTAANATLMLHDVMAIQRLYGANDTAFAGDTRYGFGSNTGRDYWTLTGTDDMIYGAIWDTGGIDEINASWFAAASVIDLNQTEFSSLGGTLNNLSIAPGTVIENAIGGLGDDLLIGNSADNRLEGSSGADTLRGNFGDDTLLGGKGNDRIRGGGGIDSMDGGKGFDLVDMTDFSSNLTIDLGAQSVTVSGTVETFTSFEGAIGGQGNDQLIGNGRANDLDGYTLHDQIAGLGGNDTLRGGDGNDTLLGGRGHDRLIGGNGVDSMDGGAGRDTVDYGYTTAGIALDLAAETAGAPGTLQETIRNFEGAIGGAGADTMLGSGSKDALYGGPGADQIGGRAGADEIWGNADDDSLTGGAGRDTLHGGNDNDRLSGGLERDKLYGGDGNDRLTGNASNDRLEGDDGRDTLLGGAGNDALVGGNGDDILDGGLGQDSMFGGLGLDEVRYTYSSDDWSINLTDEIATRTGGGTEMVVAIEHVTAGSGDDTLTGNPVGNALSGQDGDDVLFGLGGFDTLSGGKGNDYLNGSVGSDVLNGGKGNDILTGGPDQDTLIGGKGDDTVDYTFSASGWTLDLKAEVATERGAIGGGGPEVEPLRGFENAVGSRGNDAIIGTNGANTLDGGNGRDTIEGGKAGDLILGGDGKDSLVGGPGNDTINGGEGADTMFGGPGSDLVTYSGSSRNWEINLQTGIALSEVTLAEAAVGFEHAEGGDGDDTILGTQGANTLTGNAGDDSLRGSGGDDLLLGGKGGDWLDGGDGDDTLEGGKGNDTVAGGFGTDELRGGLGTDWVHFDHSAGAWSLDLASGTATRAGGGSEIMSGFENVLGAGGADTITGSNGPNHILGHTGSDRVTAGGGRDTVEGGQGHDSIDGGTDNDLLSGDRGRDTVEGGAGNDTLRGAEDADLLHGGDGNDSVEGGTGADELFGDDGADTLIGGSGADRFAGGAGDDQLTSAADGVRDVFLFERGFGNDTVDGFEPGTDQLHFDDAMWEPAVLSPQEMVTTFGSLDASGTVATFALAGQVLTVHLTMSVDLEALAGDVFFF